jgi:putative oxidoreductase
MNLQAAAPYLLSLLRIVTGLLFFEYGLQKIFHLPWAVAQGPPLPPLMMAAGFIELFTGLVITFGAFTRLAALVASGEMAFAYFLVHAHRNPFPVNNQGDAAILFCFLFLFMAAAGGGPLSLDPLMRKGNATPPAVA